MTGETHIGLYPLLDGDLCSWHPVVRSHVAAGIRVESSELTPALHATLKHAASMSARPSTSANACACRPGIPRTPTGKIAHSRVLAVTRHLPEVFELVRAAVAEI